MDRQKFFPVFFIVVLGVMASTEDNMLRAFEKTAELIENEESRSSTTEIKNFLSLSPQCLWLPNLEEW